MSVLMMLVLFGVWYLQQQLAGFWLAAGIATAIAIVLAITDNIGDKSISCRAVRPSDAFIVIE